MKSVILGTINGAKLSLWFGYPAIGLVLENGDEEADERRKGRIKAPRRYWVHPIYTPREALRSSTRWQCKTLLLTNRNSSGIFRCPYSYLKMHWIWWHGFRNRNSMIMHNVPLLLYDVVFFCYHWNHPQHSWWTYWYPGNQWNVWKIHYIYLNASQYDNTLFSFTLFSRLK